MRNRLTLRHRTCNEGLAYGLAWLVARREHVPLGPSLACVKEGGTGNGGQAPTLSHRNRAAKTSPQPILAREGQKTAGRCRCLLVSTGDGRQKKAAGGRRSLRRRHLRSFGLSVLEGVHAPAADGTGKVVDLIVEVRPVGVVADVVHEDAVDVVVGVEVGDRDL